MALLCAVRRNSVIFTTFVSISWGFPKFLPLQNQSQCILLWTRWFLPPSHCWESGLHFFVENWGGKRPIPPLFLRISTNFFELGILWGRECLWFFLVWPRGGGWLDILGGLCIWIFVWFSFLRCHYVKASRQICRATGWVLHTIRSVCGRIHRGRLGAGSRRLRCPSAAGCRGGDPDPLGQVATQRIPTTNTAQISPLWFYIL